ncbi:MAG: ribosome maturation factor RimP [Alphaproteobacteria bacterium]
MRRESELERTLRELAEPTLESMGFELVAVRVMGHAHHPTVQIMAERADGTMDVDACAEVSRTLSAIFDVEDPITSEYVLEVSSPGLERPLTREKDFTHYDGRRAKITLADPIDGQRKFVGVLDGVEDGEVRLSTDDFGILGFAFSLIERAQLVLDEDEVRQSFKRASNQAPEQAKG